MSLKPAAAKAGYDYTGEKYKSPAGILLHSRTAVEKDNFISTGVLSYAEGDILEIEMSEFKQFDLGDSVKITVYSPGGIYTFQSSVVAKDHGSLMLINPPHNQRLFAEKREHPRVEVDENGLIHAVIGTGRQQRRELDPKLAIHLMNISVSGIGFTVREELGLGNAGQIEVELELGFDLIGKAEIVRQEMLGERHYYGAQFIDLSGDKSTSLRAYILRKQVEAYFSRKHENAEKRLFK